MAKLKEALAKSEKPERKQQATSWKIFKAAEPGAGGNVLYVFIVDPAVKGADYTRGERSWPRRSRPTGAGALQGLRRRVRDGSEHRQPDARVGPREVALRIEPEAGLELQIQPRVDAVRWRVQRAASQLEDPVVHPQPQRADQRDLHAAAGVDAEARVLVRPERLPVDSAAGRRSTAECPPGRPASAAARCPCRS